MNSQRAVIMGAGLLAVLAIADIIFELATSEPPVILTIIALVPAVVALGALGMWVAGRSRRAAMWVAVVAMAVSALLGIVVMAVPETTSGQQVYFVIFALLTVAAVYLVRGELTRGARRAPSSTKVA